MNPRSLFIYMVRGIMMWVYDPRSYQAIRIHILYHDLNLFIKYLGVCTALFLVNESPIFVHFYGQRDHDVGLWSTELPGHPYTYFIQWPQLLQYLGVCKFLLLVNESPIFVHFYGQRDHDVGIWSTELPGHPYTYFIPWPQFVHKIPGSLHSCLSC